MNAKMTLNTIACGSMAAKDEHFSSVIGQISGWLVAALDGVLDYLERRREYAALAGLDDRELKDLGICRSDIERMGASPRRDGSRSAN